MWHQSAGSRRSQSRYQRRFHRPRVEALEARRLLTTYMVMNTNDSGAGSLRQAILDVNLDTSLDTIAFNIPGTGVHTISPASALPAITNPVTIDGYTQPGASPNTMANGDNAVLEVALDGAVVGADASAGLHITAGGSTVRGLVIEDFGGTGFTTDGIRLDTNGGNTIAGNFIGTDATGNVAAGNSQNGVSVASSSNTIGGTAPAARNIISNNNEDGILISGSAAMGTVVQGNFVEANLSGVVLNGVSSATIGGTTSGARNFIFGNDLDGVAIEDSSGIVVQGNNIGVDATGNALFGDSEGVAISSNSSHNTIGGTSPAAGNLITGSESSEVAVLDTSTGNSILSNSIFSTSSFPFPPSVGGGLGIDLNGDGVTLNTPGGPHNGPNDLQNYPVLTSATTGTGSTTISGTLNSTPNTAFTIQFFANAAPDPSGYGQGQTYLGQVTNVMTDSSGNASFSAMVNAEPTGQTYITGTATDAGGNTSEFSRDLIPVTPFTVINTNDSGPGSLRQAILTANATSGLQTINFQIPGSGVQTIAPASPLPAITDPVIIDGYTQPGTSVNTLTDGNNAVLEIVLSGSAAGPTARFGLHITGGGSTVRGLVIDGFGTGSGGDGILIDTNGDNTITGNFIGTDPTGTQHLGNGTSGIEIESSGNTIGALPIGGPPAPAAVNVIAFNGGNGVTIGQNASDPINGDVVSGNSIFSNGLLGIDLGDDGVTPNSPGSPHSGPNALLSSPILTGVEYTANGPVVTGTLQSTPNDDDFLIQFYANAVSTGLGEGQTYLGDAFVTTDASGNGSFSATVNAEPMGQSVITATVIDESSGNTSEFSPALVAPAPSFVVTNTGDSGPGSLLQAMLDADSTAGVPTVSFAIPGPGVQIITLPSDLPRIDQPVIIDGYTQPGSSPNTRTNGDNAVLLIELVGGVLDLAGGGSTVEGLIIDLRFGIRIDSSGNLIAGNFVGIDPTGESLQGDTAIGVMATAPGNTIGGTTPADRNVITADGMGVSFFGGGTAASAQSSASLVEGNFIGTDVTGARALGSLNMSVSVTGGADITIGGSAPGAGNVIADGFLAGIALLSANNNVIAGNDVGIATSGAPLAGQSGSTGILLEDASNNTIGGTTVGARNVVSGNPSVGIDLAGGSNNVVEGNYIGTDPAGAHAVPNGQGLIIDGETGDLIGGTVPGAANLISGNTGSGITLSDSSSAGATVQGNMIGTDMMGSLALGNGQGGLIISSSNNTIGGTVPGAGNLISGNGDGAQSGILLTGAGAEDNLVEGNLIGPGSTGAAPLQGGITSSNGDGIDITAGATNNTIGGPTAGAGNTIADNAGAGIRLTNATGTAATGNTIIANKIASNGADGVTVSSGTLANLAISIASNTVTSNGVNGISLSQTSGTMISANTIANNGSDGVSINAGSGNSILSNSLSTDGSKLEIDLVNGANNQQAAPVLSSVIAAGASTTITGTLHAAPNGRYLIQFFSSAAAGVPGSGEGQTLLNAGAAPVAADSTGLAVLNMTLPVSVAAGLFLTATDTNVATGDTSQFSSALAVLAAASISNATVIAASGGTMTATFAVSLSAAVRPARHGPLRYGRRDGQGGYRLRCHSADHPDVRGRPDSADC